MKGSDILKSLFIIAIFIGIYLFSLFKSEFKNIQSDWPKYRCNPAVMPFASSFGHDPGQNFTYCIQAMQTNYMVTLLTPVHYITSVLGSMVQSVMTDINFVRTKIASLVGNLTTIISSIFGIFINMMIEFQRIIMKIKDLFNRTIGIMVSLIYIMSGGMMAGTSIIAGPIGDTLNFVRHI